MELERLRRNVNRWLVALLVATTAMFGLIGVGLFGPPHLGERIGPYCGPVVALCFWTTLIGFIASSSALYEHEKTQEKEECPSHN